MDFSFDIVDRTGLQVIILNGNLKDQDSTKALVEAVDQLIGSGKNNLVVDLKKLNYINSSGLNVLINIFTKARNAGGEMVISNVSDKVKNLLVITKLNTVFTVAETQEKAIEELSNQ